MLSVIKKSKIVQNIIGLAIIFLSVFATVVFAPSVYAAEVDGADGNTTVQLQDNGYSCSLQVNARTGSVESGFNNCTRNGTAVDRNTAINTCVAAQRPNFSWALNCSPQTITFGDGSTARYWYVVEDPNQATSQGGFYFRDKDGNLISNQKDAIIRACGEENVRSGYNCSEVASLSAFSSINPALANIAGTSTVDNNATTSKTPEELQAANCTLDEGTGTYTCPDGTKYNRDGTQISNSSSQVGQGKPADNDGNFFNWIISLVGKVFIFIIWIFVLIAKVVLGILGGMFVVLVGVNPASESLLNIAVAPWQAVISIANIILIAGIIFMGFGYILNLKAIKRDLKDFILGILIVGLLMQFTLAGTTAVINAANGVGNIIYFAAGGISSQNANTSTAINPSNTTTTDEDKQTLQSCLENSRRTGNNFVDVFICNVSQISSFDSGRKNFITLTASEVNGELIAISLLLAILIFAIMAFGRVLFVLLVRIFGLWILIIVSPLALVTAFSPLPMIKDFSKKWVDNFLKLAFAYPVFAFGITLVTLMIGQISRQIIESTEQAFPSGAGGSAQTGYDGSVTTLAAVTDTAGAATAQYASDTFLSAATIAKIMAAVFAFGLVYLFGKMFWDIFAVFWQAAKQAAGAVWNAATTGAGLVRGATDLAKNAGNFIKKPYENRLNNQLASKQSEIDKVTQRQAKLDSMAAKATTPKAKAAWLAAAQENQKKLDQLNRQKKGLENAKGRLNFVSKVGGGLMTAIGSAPEEILGAMQTAAQVPKDVMEGFAIGQKARAARRQARNRLAVEQVMRERGLGGMLDNVKGMRNLENLYTRDGKRLVDDKDFEDKRNLILDEAEASERKNAARQFGQSVAEKRLAYLTENGKKTLDQMTSEDRLAFFQAIKEASKQANGLDNVLNDGFIKSMRDGGWEALDDDTRNKLQKDYGGLMMNDAQRYAWYKSANQREVQNTNPNALAGMWKEMLAERYGGDVDKAAKELGDTTLGLVGITGKTQVGSDALSRAQTQLNESVLKKGMSSKTQEIAKRASSSARTSITYDNLDQLAEIASKDPSQQGKAAEQYLKIQRQQHFGAQLADLAASGGTPREKISQAEKIVSQMDLSAIRTTNVGDAAYSVLANDDTLTEEDRLQGARMAVLENFMADQNSAIMESVMAKAQKISTTVQSNKTATQLLDAKADGYKSMEKALTEIEQKVGSGPEIDMNQKAQEMFDAVTKGDEATFEKIADSLGVDATKRSDLMGRDPVTGKPINGYDVVIDHVRSLTPPQTDIKKEMDKIKQELSSTGQSTTLEKLAKDAGVKIDTTSTAFEIGKAKLVDDLVQQVNKGKVEIGAQSYRTDTTHLKQEDVSKDLASIVNGNAAAVKSKYVAKIKELSAATSPNAKAQQAALQEYVGFLDGVDSSIKKNAELHAKAIQFGQEDIKSTVATNRNTREALIRGRQAAQTSATEIDRKNLEEAKRFDPNAARVIAQTAGARPGLVSTASKSN
ncbi:MAG: hypothetical protein OHK0017_13450 [Patescibacteria group bacterium]